MYQMIDDPEEGFEDERVGLPLWPFAVGLGLAALVFLGVWLFSPGKAAEPAQSIPTAESREAYLAALSAPNAAIRRARLMDFQSRFPDSARMGAVQDQIDVINAAEATDWSILTQQIYDVRADESRKLAAMDWYESLWTGSLLGGRGEELENLRLAMTEIESAQPLPDRSLEPGESPIPTTIPADTLAGGPQPTMQPPIYVPPAPPIKEAEIEKDVVEMPTVRRNVSPRYPRNAQRRKIEGIVVLAFNINAKGRVDETEVISVEAERYAKDFVKAAERAAMKTRFNPKTINGEPVPARGIRKRYIFRSKS